MRCGPVSSPTRGIVARRGSRSSAAGYVVPWQPVKSWAIRDVSACGAVVVIAILLYRKILRLWWMYDDPGHLRSFGAATLREVLLPRAGNDPTFTPLLTLSLKGDLAWFGTDARFFYVHQLISLSLFIIAL